MQVPIRHVAFVVGTTGGGTGAHVRMLAAGLARRGLAVSVYGPASADAAAGFTPLPGVTFVPVEFGGRPRPGDVAAVLRLRRALRSGAQLSGAHLSGAQPAGAQPAGAQRSGAQPAGAQCSGAPRSEAGGVVHAHGLRAGALSVLALAGVRGRPAIVVTVHNGPPSGGGMPGGGVPALIYRLLERVAARGADLVLCVSSDLERRMRAAGARRVDRAVVPAADTPGGRPGPGLPVAGDRPLVLAAGRLAPQKGFGVLLEAAARWRDLEPEPLLVIAGDGPLAGQLAARAASLGVRAEFPGRRDDIPVLLAAAAVFVLPSLWEGQPLVLQEALRAGVAIVATRAGGIPDLTGDDAAVLVPPGDAAGLADAVRAVMRDPGLAARLRAAASDRGAALPTEDDAVAAALASYADVARA